MLIDLQKNILLRLARQSIEEELGQQARDPVAEEELDHLAFRQHAGVFVTLHFAGMLRGCIGSLLGVESLIAAVRRHAINAALHDNRFPLLTVDELAEVLIEISVLTPPQHLAYRDGADLIRCLRPHIDGVILKIPGGLGATFLPQVWKQLPEPATFLGHLCLKAGLAADTWQHGELTVQTYQACYFNEQAL